MIKNVSFIALKCWLWLASMLQCNCYDRYITWRI